MGGYKWRAVVFEFCSSANINHTQQCLTLPPKISRRRKGKVCKVRLLSGIMKTKLKPNRCFVKQRQQH